MKKPEEKSSLLVLFLILILGSGFLFWKANQPHSGSLDESSYSSFDLETQEKVNKHLYLTQQRIELEQRQKEIANRAWAPSVGDAVLPSPKKDLVMDGVDHSVDSNEFGVANDLNREKKQLGFNTGRAQVQGQVQDEIIAADYDKRYKAEYARQFIENANKAGYEVVLDENYVVVKVKRKPAQADKKNLPHLFPGSPAGAQ